METSVPPPKGLQQATAASIRTPCGIGDLPLKVLEIIFKFFNVQQLDGTISPVCRLWRDLSQRPDVRLKIELEDKGPKTAAACRLLRSCPKLKDLSITGRKDTDHLLLYVALYNKDLRRLALKEINDMIVYLDDYPRVSEHVLEDVLLCCPHIVDLTITNAELLSTKFYHDLGVRLPELRKINFNSVGNNLLFGPDELRAIVSHCGKLEEISAINRDLPLSDEDISFGVKRLSRTLKVLEIDGSKLSDKAAAALGQCCQLRKLHILNACEITDVGVYNFSRLHNLESLDLTGTKKVSSCGWVQLFSRSHWRQMKNLSLSANPNVNDDTVQMVASTCPNLVTLNLAWCDNFTAEGLKSVLQMCTNIKDIAVWTTRSDVSRSFSQLPFVRHKIF